MSPAISFGPRSESASHFDAARARFLSAAASVLETRMTGLVGFAHQLPDQAQLAAQQADILGSFVDVRNR